MSIVKEEKNIEVCCLSISSAFNIVNFDILLGTIPAVNVSSTAGYLIGRQQRLRANDVNSELARYHSWHFPFSTFFSLYFSEVEFNAMLAH